MPQGMGYEKYDSAGKPKKAGSKSPIDMGNSMAGPHRGTLASSAMKSVAKGMSRMDGAKKAAAKKAPPKKSAKSAEGIIGKTGGRMVGGYAPTGRGKANSRVAQTSWSKAGGARQNKKKGKSLPTTK